jgi:hypothetical protein
MISASRGVIVHLASDPRPCGRIEEHSVDVFATAGAEELYPGGGADRSA